MIATVTVEGARSKETDPACYILQVWSPRGSFVGAWIFAGTSEGFTLATTAVEKFKAEARCHVSIERHVLSNGVFEIKG